MLVTRKKCRRTRSLDFETRDARVKSKRELAFLSISLGDNLLLY
jgi:hypothetical protein